MYIMAVLSPSDFYNSMFLWWNEWNQMTKTGQSEQKIEWPILVM